MGRSAHLTLTAYRSTVHSGSHQVLGALPSLTHLTQSASIRFSTPAPLLARTSRSSDSVHNRPVLRYLQPRNFAESGYNPVVGTEYSAFQGCARRSPVMDRSLSSVVEMRQRGFECGPRKDVFASAFRALRQVAGDLRDEHRTAVEELRILAKTADGLATTHRSRVACTPLCPTLPTVLNTRHSRFPSPNSSG